MGGGGGDRGEEGEETQRKMKAMVNGGRKTGRTVERGEGEEQGEVRRHRKEMGRGASQAWIRTHAGYKYRVG